MRTEIIVVGVGVECQTCARQDLQRFYFAPRSKGKGTAQALGEPVRVVTTYSDLELLSDLVAKNVLEDYFHGRRAGKANPYRLTAPQVAMLLGIGVTLGISDHLIAAVRRLLEVQLPAPLPFTTKSTVNCSALSATLIGAAVRKIVTSIKPARYLLHNMITVSLQAMKAA